jgi:hypothetical protein
MWGVIKKWLSDRCWHSFEPINGWNMQGGLHAKVQSKCTKCDHCILEVYPLEVVRNYFNNK